MELNEILNRTADRIVADGTHSESRILHAMASAAGILNPGASEALIDWNGSEVARLRAFGILHGVLLRDLAANEQMYLTAELLNGHALELAA
ncbi:hypothetical protein [Arthrobacter sp. R4-81]